MFIFHYYVNIVIPPPSYPMPRWSPCPTTGSIWRCQQVLLNWFQKVFNSNCTYLPDNPLTSRSYFLVQKVSQLLLLHRSWYHIQIAGIAVQLFPQGITLASLTLFLSLFRTIMELIWVLEGPDVYDMIWLSHFLKNVWHTAILKLIPFQEFSLHLDF